MYPFQWGTAEKSKKIPGEKIQIKYSLYCEIQKRLFFFKIDFPSKRKLLILLFL